MPTLIIDDRSVTVPEGTNVLEAAKLLGIVIPHFCYHEALGSVGACRLCAMMFVEGPVKGIQMSCMIPAKDGMVVSTLHDDATAYRAQVIEWLMMNHPHDCPVCDEGGECQLQDMTVAGGHSIRRFTGKKRTFLNQQLGPFIYQEMNRCIQCYRCVRTYQDYCGGTDFGVMGVNQRLFFGRFTEGALESPFAGNLADVCPTGVFTDKTFRFKARFWDLQEAPSVCEHCSLGCAVFPGARFNELQRVRARVNEAVNGYFICDRGRFGYGYINHPERPRVPILDGEPKSWSSALIGLQERLNAVSGIALLGSGRASLEANYLLHSWSERLGGSVTYGVHAERDLAARALAAFPSKGGASLTDVRDSDLIVVVGADPLNEGPGFALALRQAVRKGGRVVVIDPRPVDLPCTVEHLLCRPEELPELIAALADPQSANVPDAIREIATALQESQRPVLGGGSDLLGEACLTRLMATAERLSTAERTCRTFVLLPEANSFGAALFSSGKPTFDEILDDIEKGKIKALVCLETDPLGDYPDTHRVSNALAKLELLVVLDYLPTATALQANLLLPTTAIAESDGTLINNEGRMLRFEQVFKPGLPVRLSGGGDHPPRIFTPKAPGNLPCPAWAVLAEVLGHPLDLNDLHNRMVNRDQRLKGLENLKAEEEGLRIGSTDGKRADAPSPLKEDIGGWRVLGCQNLYGSEPLSVLSSALAPVLPEPWAWLQSDDARDLQLVEGDLIRLHIGDQMIRLPVKLSDTMAGKLVIVPHLRGTRLENFHPGKKPIPCRVEKESRP